MTTPGNNGRNSGADHLRRISLQRQQWTLEQLAAGQQVAGLAEPGDLPPDRQGAAQNRSSDAPHAAWPHSPNAAARLALRRNPDQKCCSMGRNGPSMAGLLQAFHPRPHLPAVIQRDGVVVMAKRFRSGNANSFCCSSRSHDRHRMRGRFWCSGQGRRARRSPEASRRPWPQPQHHHRSARRNASHPPELRHEQR